jgi:heme exporter protein B
MWGEQVWAVVRKDLLVETRSRANFNAMLFFAGIVLLIFSFALGPNHARLQSAAGGLLWLAFIFAGLLAFGRAYAIESENDAFEGLLLIAQHRSAIYLGKLLAAMAVMLLIEIVVVPLMALLYSANLLSYVPQLLLIGVLGTAGFAAIGTLYGALTMSLRARELLLPLLLLPVTVPVIVASVKSTTLVLAGNGQDIGVWLSLLVAFDVVFVTAGLLSYEYAAGE